MADAEFRILCWEGYEDETVLAPFSARSGVRASGEHFLSDAQAVRRIVASPGAFDIINLNSPYTQQQLYPAGHILSLDAEAIDPAHTLFPELLAPLYARADGADDGNLIGVGQRFGPFNLVVNTSRLSPKTAADQGFHLASDASNTGRYGILEFPDFNILHICFGAGLNPFKPLSPAELDTFSGTARLWFENAAMVTGDHTALNTALACGDIDFYLSSGRFSVAAARAAGCSQIEAVTPERGPVDGKGAVMFMEMTSVVAGARAPRQAVEFLKHILEPSRAHSIATLQSVRNPVVQMADPAVFDLFDRADLDAIQWDTLEEELSRCVEFDVPPDAEELGRRLDAARQDAQPPA